ncbi:hypothetical protein ACP70R_016052 [Stipagrostis hirtigluma subsp. patula]
MASLRPREPPSYHGTCPQLISLSARRWSRTSPASAEDAGGRPRREVPAAGGCARREPPSSPQDRATVSRSRPRWRHAAASDEERAPGWRRSGQARSARLLPHPIDDAGVGVKLVAPALQWLPGSNSQLSRWHLEAMPLVSNA